MLDSRNSTKQTRAPHGAHPGTDASTQIKTGSVISVATTEQADSGADVCPS